MVWNNLPCGGGGCLYWKHPRETRGKSRDQALSAMTILCRLAGAKSLVPMLAKPGYDIYLCVS